MNYSMEIWPSSDMDFWNINDVVSTVTIKWSHDFFDDYKLLSFQFYECGYKTFDEVISSGDDNIKADMWFLTGIFLVRHSLELGLKALLCRILPRKKDIQEAFEECCHDVFMLYHKYSDKGKEKYLSNEEEKWLIKYLKSLEEVDKKSDMFRFPFENEFLSKYRNEFLDNEAVANNLLQAYALVKKCIERGIVAEEDEFDEKLKPEFFVFASHGIGNCYLWQSISDEGFHVKVTGYSEVIDYIYQNQNITNEDKLYPLIFMFRNTIELCLKRLFYSRVVYGVPLKVFNSKRKSHLIKKDLWKNVKPVIVYYATESGEELKTIEIVENMLLQISSIDKNGDIFRYPTSYSLEYRFDNKTLDINNVYLYLRAIIKFLDSCDLMLDVIADYESEMRTEYESEMRANIDWL
ncbi:MAG: hypothetical protein J5582_04095 [Ruminococcus sp.]|uniref:hypothetical protein n=1 Tax=Ruminococcus sp. TaxID=41978 RepID=UPI0025E13338|nr:hypothetical protein [Ruminococcus sp.]MBO4865737.1 hypothetical protein [Ruminococcus sp.]